MRGKASHTRWLLRLLFLLVASCTAAAAKVVYVDDSAIGTNDGTSWADAYNYLQDALADANTAPKPVEIRIAQGIYMPDQGAGITRGDPGVEFQLINGVTVCGGFAGVGAIEPDARDIEIYKTILNGDLSGDDADVDDPDDLSGEPTRAENSFTVVSGSDTDETAVLDGVTITAGDTGMRNWLGNPTVKNCTFTNSREGISNIRSSQTLTNCIFRSLGLFTIHQNEGSLELINCLFSGNTGGIHIGSRGELTLHNCTFADNVIGSGTIGCYLVENLRMYNCIFRNNIARSVAGVSADVRGEFIADNCTFTGNIGSAIDYRSGPGRMVLTNCLFAGNQGCVIDSHSEYLTIESCTFSSNSTNRDGSALNAWFGPKVSNCIFWGNSSPAIKVLREGTVMNYCDIEGGWPGEGNIDVDPGFVSPGYWDQNNTPEDTADDFWVDGDYHLRSQAGRWEQESQTWVQDDVTSPCIDAGDPNSPIGTEPFPNGGRVNIGAYGASDKASKTYFGGPVCETIIAGDINGDCVVDFEDQIIMISHWMMQGDDFKNKLSTVRVLEPKDGDRIAWPGPTKFLAEASDADGQVKEVMFWIKHETDGGYTSRGLSADEGTDGWEQEYTWKEDLPSGTWIVWAEATDNEGQVGLSPEITVTLYRP